MYPEAFAVIYDDPSNPKMRRQPEDVEISNGVQKLGISIHDAVDSDGR